MILVQQLLKQLVQMFREKHKRDTYLITLQFFKRGRGSLQILFLINFTAIGVNHHL